MARIRTYEFDTTISADDYLLGNDVGSNNAVATKRFALDDLKEFLAIGIDITEVVPARYVPVVTPNGQSIERSLIRMTRDNGVVQAAFTSFDFMMDILNDGNNGITIRLKDYNEAFELASFVGDSFTAVTLNGETYTGTISSYSGFQNYVDNGVVEVRDTFVVTLTAGQIVENAAEVLTNLTVSSLVGLNLILNNATFEGPTQFEGDLTIGTLSPETDPVDINLHGILNLPTEESGVTFGSNSTSVTLGVDNDGLVSSGDGKILLENETTFSEDITLDDSEDNEYPSLIVRGGDIQLHQYEDEDGDDVGGVIRTFDPAGTEGLSILPVAANRADGDNDRGLLTGVRVGEDNYHLPTATSSVSQVIPGLLEELVAPTTGFNTGTFFYGTDRGTFAEYESALTTAVPALSITANFTRRTIALTETAINTALVSAFGNIPADQRLMFVAGSPMSVATPDRVTLDDGLAFGTGIRFYSDAAGVSLVAAGTASTTGQVDFNTPGVTSVLSYRTVHPTTSVVSDPITTGFTLVAATLSQAATQGVTLSGNVFEVTNYDALEFNTATPPVATEAGEIEYTRIGQGAIQIASRTLSLDSPRINITNVPGATGTDQNILFRDAITGQVRASSISEIAGAESQVRWCPDDDASDLTNLGQINFEGAMAQSGTVTTGGGRFSEITGGDITTATTVGYGDLVVLGNIASQEVITLPAGSIGGTIRIINASTFGTGTGVGIWRITPASGEFIATEANLDLDDRTANFDITYVNDTLGWMIIQ